MAAHTIECSSGKLCIINAINARVIKISPIVPQYEIFENNEYGKNVLTSLNYDGMLFKSGQEILVGKGTYKINNIKKFDSNGEHGAGYYLYTCETNKSSMFLLPFLGEDRGKMKWNSTFLNCFIGTEAWGSTGSLYLWYRFNGTPEGLLFEQKLLNHPNYLATHDVDKYHALYEFSVPEQYLDAYELILEGKYSKIEDSVKQRILEFHFSTKERPLGKILYKSPARKADLEKYLNVHIPDDVELHDVFYERDEIFYDKYIISGEATLKK